MELNNNFEYLKLAQTLQNDIVSGLYKEGSKLPSVRSLKNNYGLSISTILKSFYELEKRGFIIAKEKYGYFVKANENNKLVINIKSYKPKAEPVNKCNLISSVIQTFNNREIFSLGSSLLTPKLTPSKKITEVFKKAINQKNYDINNYSLPPGYEPLRYEILMKYKEYGLELSLEDIVITNGCMDAISLALRSIAKQGDIIAIESPTYYGFLQLIEIMGMYALEIPTDPVKGIDIEQFELLMKKHHIKACIFVPNFNNPLGSLMPDENKKKICDIIKTKNTYIIESDVYSDLYFGTYRPKPLKYFDNNDLVITCSSLSKTLSAGLRIGWMINKKLSKHIQKLQFVNSISVPTLTQIASYYYLKDHTHERFLKNLRKQLKNQYFELKNMVLTNFKNKVKLSEPQGGFLLWLELEPEINSLNVYQECLVNNISIIPSTICYASEKFQNYIRLSYAYSDRYLYEKNLKILANIINNF